MFVSCYFAGDTYKENHQQSEEIPTELEKILPAMHLMVSPSSIYKELQELNLGKSNHPINTWANWLNKQFSKTYKWSIHILKCTQHVRLLRKSKLKAFWDSIPSQAEWLPSTNVHVDLGKGGDLYAAVHTSDNTGIKPTELPRGPAIPLLGMNPKDSRSAHYRNTCTPCSLLHCAYQPRHGSSLDVPQQMNG